MTIMINHGAGPCVNTTWQNAENNIKRFLIDCELGAKYERVPSLDYGEGRYAFIIWKNNICAEIQMPGLPLAQVRWMDHSQDIWQFPRLYIDDGSWIWKVAIGIIKEIFASSDDNEE